MSSQSTTSRSIIYLGMDVHKDSVTIAVLPATAKAAMRVDRLRTLGRRHRDARPTAT